LQGFGSFEGVKRTKGELYDFLASTGAIDNFVVNADDADLVEMAEQRFGVSVSQVIGTPYSLNPDEKRAYVIGNVIACDPYLRFTWRMGFFKADETPVYEVTTHLIGSYNVYNALAAIVLGIRFGVSSEQICHAIENYIPSNNRSQLTITQHNKLIVDAYNANPTSMMAALKNFRDMQVENKMAILGDMRELGADSAKEHAKIIDFIESANIKDVWLVGEEFGKTNCAFRKYHDVEEVKKEIAQSRPEGRCILIKGSNSIHLSQLPELL
jgi:UDP-N-acetylmuramoyl-tripeptide--D-alanyl-D-alanine ligase